MWHKGKSSAGIVAFIFLMFMAVSSYSQNALKMSEINVAVSRGPVTLDPRFATDAASVRLLKLIAPGVIQLDKQFQPQSAYLKLFGQKRYQQFYMEVKDGVTFSNGQPLTVEYLKGYYESILDKETKSPLRGAFTDVESINVEGDRLVINLGKANPYFWGVLETSVVWLDDGEFKSPIGLGVYSLKKETDQGDVTLARQDGLQILNFKVIKDPVVRYLKLARGELDIIHNDVGEEILQYAKEKGFALHESPSTSYTYMGFLLDKGPTSEVELRKALSYAINRGEIVKMLLGGRARAANSLLSNSHPAFYDADAETYDPKLAEKLLEDMGHIKDEHGIRLTLRLAITSSPFIQRVAQVIQQQLSEIGVKVVISSSEWGTFYGNIKKGNFESYILTWVGRFQSDIFKSLFHSSMMPPMGANRGRYASLEMDELLDSMMSETHDETRYNLAKQVQKLQEKDVIYIPLWRRSHVAIVAPNIEGYRMESDGGYTGLETAVKH